MGSYSEEHDQAEYTADEALARLKEGNARFISGHARFPTVQKEILAELTRGQRPFATLLGCSDSRVPPELVFDASFGELFVVRVAGNVLDPAIAGSLQYAGVHLHTPLLVVLGHEGCGAVQAAIAERFHGAQHHNRISLLLDSITPALDTLDPTAASRGFARSGDRGERAPDTPDNRRFAGMAGSRGQGRRPGGRRHLQPVQRHCPVPGVAARSDPSDPA